MGSDRTWNITRHALDRFVERFAPESSNDEALSRMRALLDDAVEVGQRDTGQPEDRGVLMGSTNLPAVAFLCRPDTLSSVPGMWVCVTTLDSPAHQQTFRGAKWHRESHRHGGRRGMRRR